MNIILIFLSFVVFKTNRATIQRSGVDLFTKPWKNHRKYNFTVEELIQSNGYKAETHEVTTTDGYILTLHRIPRDNTVNNNGKVAFLQHGVLLSSADWAIMGAGKALAFLLADEGYDVWMGNVRGNTYSRKHTVLDPSEAKFWDFSIHELGIIDAPQMIDYVLNETQADGVYFVGHSQGTTVYYIMTSMLPEYNSKIKVQVSLAPVGYTGNMFNPYIQFLTIFTEEIGLLLRLAGVNEFLPTSDFQKYVIGDVFCQKGSATQELCINFFSSVFGFNRKQVNTTLLPFLFKFAPAGCSRKQLEHFGQQIQSGYFRQYDYGVLGNLREYGHIFPPSYNLEHITAPTYLLYSRNDWLSAEVDVQRVCEEMTTGCKGRILVSDPQWSHMDYLYGIDAPELIYSIVLSLFADY